MSNSLVLGLATVFWWLIVGVFLYPVLASLVFSLYAQQCFKATSGQVTESLLKEVSGSDSTTYEPIVAYDYSVNNAQFQGNHIYWTPVAESWPLEMAQYMQARYPIAAQVTVYYDPDNPRLAVLETHVLKYRAFHLFVLFPFVVMGAILSATFIGVGPRRTGRRGRDKTTSIWGRRVLPTWFVAHLLTGFALAIAGAYLPDRIWLVGIGVIVVATATLLAALPIDRLAVSPRRRRTAQVSTPTTTPQPAPRRRRRASRKSDPPPP